MRVRAHKFALSRTRTPGAHAQRDPSPNMTACAVRVCAFARVVYCILSALRCRARCCMSICKFDLGGEILWQILRCALTLSSPLSAVAPLL